MKDVRVGFMPLIDAAIPIAAVECGFAAREGLNIALVRETSWANIRDKLIHEMFDASHMLAPLAVATSLGLRSARVPLAVPFALNANGNCITLASSLYRMLEDVLGRAPQDAREAARAFRIVLDRRHAAGQGLVTFGVVFPFSVHAIMVRHWLRLGGIDPSSEVQFQVVPPPFMVASLAEGVIEGCCVGEPWSSRAVESGVGGIVAFGAEITRFAPDKVLAFRQSLAEENPEMVSALMRAYQKAAQWCGDPQNFHNLAQIMAQPEYLGVSPKTVLSALTGTLQVSRTQSRHVADFLAFQGDEINRPDPRKARWLYAEMMFALRHNLKEEEAAAAASVFRPDLYDAGTGRNFAAEPADPIQLRYGPAFDSSRLEAYVAALRRGME